MGYGDLFQNFNAGAIADDHYYINRIARIPMIDIINRPMKTESGFGDYHHTHDDDIDIIDKRTLRVVGQVERETIEAEMCHLRALCDAGAVHTQAMYESVGLDLPPSVFFAGPASRGIDRSFDFMLDALGLASKVVSSGEGSNPVTRDLQMLAAKKK